MNINPDKLTMSWEREGLNVKQDGRQIALLDITVISLLGIEYGSDLDIQPAGWFISPRQKVAKWLETQNQKQAISG